MFSARTGAPSSPQTRPRPSRRTSGRPSIVVGLRRYRATRRTHASSTCPRGDSSRGMSTADDDRKMFGQILRWAAEQEATATNDYSFELLELHESVSRLY